MISNNSFFSFHKPFTATFIFFALFIASLAIIPARFFVRTPEILSFDKLQPTHSSIYINENILKQKIKQGLPDWAMQQIKQDLAPFKAFNIANIEHYHSDPDFKMLGRFQIANGVVMPILHEKLDILPSYKTLLDMLQYLARHGYVTNTNFLVGLGEYFSPSQKLPIPVFAFAKDLNKPFEKDLIMIPDWINLGKVTEFRERIYQAKKKYPWETKTPILFWRGGEADSSGFRHKLVLLAQRKPALIDAKFVTLQQGYVPPEEHLKYKYLISIDGVRCAWTRLVWHLHSNSLVFKPYSTQIQWFYNGIKPYQHYIPIQDEETLIQQIQWANSHPDEAKQITDNASQFIEDNLSLEDMYHYMIVLLNEYKKLTQSS